MFIGHQKLEDTFKKLADTNKLSHAYLFFGEPQVGKFSFAVALANYLENSQLEKPSRTLTETLIIRPDEEGTIGINNIRELKRFLLQKPAYSPCRTVIVDNAEHLSGQAQHAILKIAEEPPSTGLIILIVTNPDILLPTLQSRLQKIYFPRVTSDLITAMLVKELKMKKAEAAGIAQISFGRPGRAMKLAEGKGPVFSADWRIRAGKGSKKALIEQMTESPKLLEENLTEIIAKLARDPVRNYETLRSVLNRLTKISQFNTNKRLQLESALWNI